MSYYDKGFSGNNLITYPQIVMEQIQIIQKIYSKELRDGDKVLKNALGEQIIEGEDTRYSFLQAIEAFGSLLFPYFIKTTKQPFINYCRLLDKEIVEMIEMEKFADKVKKIFLLDDKVKLIDKIKTDEIFKNQINLFFLNYKVKHARHMFRTLLQLFKDNDFLSNEIYTDSEVDSSSMTYVDKGDDDLVFDEEDEDTNDVAETDDKSLGDLE